MRLVLQFLGIPQLQLNDQPIVTDRRKAIALLAYLAVNDIGQAYQRYSRESLSALLWPDYNQAKAYSNLRRTIWEVHQATGDSWLLADRGSVCLNSESEIDLDVAHFRDLLAKSRQQADPRLRISLLSESVKLYRNHFLTGFSLKDAPAFNEWVFAESEDLRRQLAEGLTMLSDDYCALGETEKAIPYARRLITLDPLNESSHRQLMQVYIQDGQHSAALKQYQTCEQILRQEMGLDPQPETLALYKKIRKGDKKPSIQPASQTVETTAPPHNLPLHLTNFIGREREQKEITDLIANNRLVTVTGAGGIGKTRLSLKTGEQVLGEYPNGVWLVELAALSDPDLVPQAVAILFGVAGQSEDSLTDRVIRILRAKTALLILDNCEHLLTACAQFADTLLKNCPTLRILVTSRATLNIAGEATYSMPSLSIPERNNASVEALTDYESIQLFTERAALALSAFALTKENAVTVADICRRVDGIPLAIELGAARVNMLQVDEILQQLEDSYSLLASDGHATLPRHQTLRASLDWSWNLLTDLEQTFMRQLSVFAGGWNLESAQAVCDGDVLNLISALVRKSLIVVSQEAGCETRYRFHEIVRQYVREKWVKANEEENGRTRHLKYYLELSEQAERALKGPAQEAWRALLMAERDNIRAGLDWADKTNVEVGLYISGRLHLFWETFDLCEGARWLAAFIQKPESKDHPLARAKALLAQGYILMLMEQSVAAHSAAQECLDLYKACGDRFGEIDGLLVLGNSYDLSKVSELTELHQQALTLSKSLGDPWRQARALNQLSWTGKNDSLSISYLEEAVALFLKVGDLGSATTNMLALGKQKMWDGDLQSAQEWLGEAVKTSRRIKNKRLTGDIHEFSAEIEFRKGDYEKARVKFQESITIAEEMGNRTHQFWGRSCLGQVALRQGSLNEARDLFTEAVDNFQKAQHTDGVIFALEGIAGLCVAIGKPEQAARLVGWADATREKIYNPRPPIEQADVDRDISAIRAKIGSAAFEVAYDKGREMTLDEAVAFALRER